MNMKITQNFRLLGALLLAALAVGTRADIQLGSLFQDHAVLQRDQPVPVWGTAAAGESVTVVFRGQTETTTAGADGRWSVTLKPMAASAEPAVLVARGRNEIRLADLLTGEVWLASGQSNMEFRVDQADNAKKEIAAALHPLIRQFDVSNRVAESPQSTCAGAWELCSPATVGKFSAVAYFFARDWQQATGVPVGIINSTWGGTLVESWMSQDTLKAEPAFAASLARWAQTVKDYPVKRVEFDTALAKWETDEKMAATAGKAARADFVKAHPKPRAPRGPGHHWTPAGLYNGMIAPLVPYALGGVIWYQAESNADYPAEYAALFGALIRQWRQEWRQELPFYFVQIANFNGTPADRAPRQWAWLRDAQAQALALPKTGMAVAIDIGAADNIHPKNKQEVGRRLGLLARHELRGEPGEFSGPVLARCRREGAALRLEFSHAAGLTTGGLPLVGLEIAGADRAFQPAEARVDGETVVVFSKAVTEPMAVRYAWTNAPVARLKNGAGLPAAPFRTDEWKD